MIRSSRATGKQTRATAVPGVSPQIAAMLSSSLPFQGDATELYAQLNNSGQRRRISTRPAPQANLVRLPLNPPSPPPSWGSFTGGNGLFSGSISRPSVRLAESILDQLQYQVELADNTAFSTNVISLDLGNARKFEHRLSSATKFARLRARWVTSDWTAWVAFGSPTSVASGVPVSGSGDIADGSVTDPKITGTRSLVGSGAVDASKNIDLAGTAWVNKNLTNVADGSARLAATAATTSYRPLTNPLTATDAGSNATVSIAAFTMRVAGKGDISISSSSITALSYATLYFIYYDDSTFAGGSVTFVATTTKETVLNGAGRFFVGSIVTPVAVAPDTVGRNDGGVGAQTGGHVVRYGTLSTSGDSNSVLVFSSSSQAIDRNFSTSAQLSGSGVDLSSEIGQISMGGFGSPEDEGRYFYNIKLKMKVGGTCTNESNVGAGQTSTLKAQWIGSSGATDIRSASATGNGASATLATQTDIVSPPNGTRLGDVTARIRFDGAVGGTNNDGSVTLNAYEAVLEADY